MNLPVLGRVQRTQRGRLSHKPVGGEIAAQEPTRKRSRRSTLTRRASEGETSKTSQFGPRSRFGLVFWRLIAMN